MATAALLALLLSAPGPQAPVAFQRYLDRTEGAFVVLVPRGWLTEGGMVRVNPTAAGGPGQSIEAKIDFAVKREREGRVAIRWLPHVNHIQPVPGVAVQGTGGLPVAPMPTPRAFALRQLLPRLRPGARDVKTEKVEPRPDVVEAVRAGPKAQGLLASGAQYAVQAEAVTVTYEERGTRYREQLFVAIEGFAYMGTSLWSNAFTIVARAPEAEYEGHGRVASVIVSSFALNPRWVVGEVGGQQQRGRVVEQTQAAIAKIDEEIAASRSRTRSTIQDQEYLTLTGQERWVNPHTGRPELGSNAWKHRWEDAWGQLIYTDDDRWDPNIDPNLQVSGFKRSPPQRR